MDFYAEPWVYDLWFKGVDGDEAFWPELVRRGGGVSVLELGCGTGRLLLPLARELVPDGFRVIGLDAAPQMLDVLREALVRESPGVQAAVSLHEADMRSYDLAERFDFAFIGFNTFAHLLEIEDQLACLRTTHRHLVKGGRLAIEVNFHPPDQLAENLESRPLALQGHVRDESTGETTLFLHTARYYSDTQTSDELLRLERIDRHGQAHVTNVELPLHIFSPRELQLLFRLAGFEVEAVYGDADFGPLTEASDIQVVVGRVV